MLAFLVEHYFQLIELLLHHSLWLSKNQLPNDNFIIITANSATFKSDIIYYTKLLKKASSSNVGFGLIASAPLNLYSPYNIINNNYRNEACKLQLLSHIFSFISFNLCIEIKTWFFVY